MRPWSRLQRAGVAGVALALAACAPSSVAATQTPAPTAVPPEAATGAHAPMPRPTLVVSANAEVSVVPDRASLSVAVETRGRTAAEAASANARLQTSILDAVKAAGVAPAQLRTTALSVNPEYQYPERGGRPTVVGYQARNSVEIEIRDLTKVGPIVDAALSQGATNLAGPTFFASDYTAARKAALEQAVRKARAEAETIAVAAGVRLQSVLEISTDYAVTPVAETPMYRARAMLSSDAAATTPVESGELKVGAQVTIRYLIEQR